MRSGKQIIKRFQTRSWDDLLFDFLCSVFLIAVVVIVFYPIYFVFLASFTDPARVNSGELLLFPTNITLDGYKMVFKNVKIWRSYGNTIYYTLCGTALGTVITVMAGYALAQKDLIGRSLLMKLFVFSMYFSGGIIPLYLVVRQLNMVGTRSIIIILGSVSVYNIIVVRSFMMTNIPEELYDAAIIDGCGHGTFFVKIVVPLSKAVISVVVLYLAVSYWNSYFNAMIFLTDGNDHPLQLYIRELLNATSTATEAAQKGERFDPEYVRRMNQLAASMKYSVIVVATAPILCVYPFIQKYFVKGVMIGSVKG